MPAIVTDALFDWKMRQLKRVPTKKCPWQSAEELIAPGAPVFVSTRTWTNYSYSGFRSSFTRLLKRHHLDQHGITAHRFRHTFATVLLEKGINPRVVQEILGHAKITTTLGTYSHVVRELFDGAAEVMDLAYKEMQAGVYAPEKRSRINI